MTHTIYTSPISHLNVGSLFIALTNRTDAQYFLPFSSQRQRNTFGANHSSVSGISKGHFRRKTPPPLPTLHGVQLLPRRTSGPSSHVHSSLIPFLHRCAASTKHHRDVRDVGSCDVSLRMDTFSKNEKIKGKMKQHGREKRCNHLERYLVATILSYFFPDQPSRERSAAPSTTTGPVRLAPQRGRQVTGKTRR